MTSRRYAAAAFFSLSCGLHLWALHGSLDGVNPALLPLSVMWLAFTLPGIGAVGQFERHVLGFQPWAADHHATSMLYAVAFAVCFWFFPAHRISRWFGTFNAFGGGNSRRPLPLVRGAAYVLDAVNKRLFGRQKTGGWA